MNRRFWANLSSLYGIHLLNYIAPLLTIPYLTRALGPVHWGALAFAEAYANVAGLLIEYGFGLSATREVARVRGDAAARSEQLAGVLGAQVVLGGGVLLATAGAALFLPSLMPYKSLFPFAFFVAFARALNPIWYFQGLEKLHTIALLTIVTNLGAAGAIFALVRTGTDAWITLALRGGALFVCAGAAFVVAYRDTPFLLPSWKASRQALWQGSSLFLFRSAVSLYTSANVLLLGFLAAPAAVAWFAGAEKIARVAASSVTPVTQAFYPRIVSLLTSDRSRAKRALFDSVWLTLGIGLAAGITLFALAPLMVRILLGAEFTQSVPVVRLLALTPPLIAGSNLLGIQWMLPLRMDRQFNWIVVIAGAVNLLLASLLAPRYQERGMAGSVVFSELAVTAAMAVVLWWLQRTPRSAVPKRAAA